MPVGRARSAPDGRGPARKQKRPDLRGGPAGSIRTSGPEPTGRIPALGSASVVPQRAPKSPRGFPREAPLGLLWQSYYVVGAGAGGAASGGAAASAGAQVGGQQVLGAQVLGRQVRARFGRQVLGAQVAGAQVSGAQVTGSQTAGAQVAGAQVAGSQVGAQHVFGRQVRAASAVKAKPSTAISAMQTTRVRFIRESSN